MTISRSAPPGTGWQIWVDTGGTFTDCLARGPGDEQPRRIKVLSSGVLRGRIVAVRPDGAVEVEGRLPPASALRGYTLRVVGAASGGQARVLEASDLPASAPRARLRLSAALDGVSAGASFELTSGEPAPLVAARVATETPADQPLPSLAMRLATTRGTNALLERRGAPVALFVTRGFADLLEIGDQQRPDLFALAIEKRQPLHAAVVEVDERVAADGQVVRPLELESVAREARRLLAGGVIDAAVALVNSYRAPEHERRVAELLSDLGFRVSRSAELSPLIKLLPRAETALVDAYLGPAIDGFRGEVAAGIGGDAGLLMMTSAGGLVRASRYRPKDCLLSGPAGGVVGAAFAGLRAGARKVISFDMGGTSTDVARFDGELDYRYDRQVGDARVAAPMLAIETVAAGGGSICSYRHGELSVGPHSAGADPGPACYGAGGPLTLTDVNLLLGRLSPARFGIPVEHAAARRALAGVVATLGDQTGDAVDEDDLLEGLLAIADERMADAIRKVSLRRGYDPAEHTMVAFGGAGPQHACGVAGRLGIRTVLVPAEAGLLSALGLGQAPVERIVERQLLWSLEGSGEPLAEVLDELAAEAVVAVIAEGVPEGEVIVRRRLLELRYAGQESTLEVDHRQGDDPSAAFAARHQALYGHRLERPVELVSVRVIASSEPATPSRAATPAGRTSIPAPAGHQRARFAGRWLEVPSFDASELRPGDELRGPAIVLDAHATTVIEPGWRATLDASATIVLEAEGPDAAVASHVTSGVEAVALELFANRLTTIAEEMGELMQRTALSTNVKERLDFSCAVLDAAGNLVVNAPHIPVHLGSLGLCVREVVAALPLGPGDVAVTNHPGYGGSHLPDVTVVTPAFAGETLIGYLATRAHHAEIGGATPGSMPPSATCLADEGVVIAPTYLVRQGRARFDELGELLSAGPHPSRAVEENLADLRAATAANRYGAGALTTLAVACGVAEVQRHMRGLEERAGREVRAALADVADGSYQARAELDDGTPLAVEIRVAGQSARIDFSGTGDVHAGNLNATLAVVRSAVIYVLRLLVRRPLPLNEGLLEAVELVVPSPSLLAPRWVADPRACPAVVGGNVETSQQLVDLLLSALGLVAGSQGTMNNLLFGNGELAYYETICGGTGAGPGFAGAHAVHSHMTNTRITDVEILEHRYPVRVERFAVRRGSGGAGRWAGGDGVIRELCFEAPMEVSLLSQRRRRGAPGLAGGQSGAPGAQRVTRADGGSEELAGIAGCALAPGDRLCVESPGGGGCGTPAGDDL